MKHREKMTVLIIYYVTIDEIRIFMIIRQIKPHIKIFSGILFSFAMMHWRNISVLIVCYFDEVIKTHKGFPHCTSNHQKVIFCYLFLLWRIREKNSEFIKCCF